MSVGACAYCGRSVELLDPRAMDEEDWTAQRRVHARGCEWVATRAHTRDRRPRRTDPSRSGPSGRSTPAGQRTYKPFNATLSPEGRAALVRVAKRHGLDLSKAIDLGMRWLDAHVVYLAEPSPEKSDTQ